MENPQTERMVRELAQALGDRLVSVVLYGSAARGDFQQATSDVNLLVVLDSLAPDRLEALSGAFGGWTRKKQPLPRVFSKELIAESADVFPIEFLDLQSRRQVLHGEDPFEGVEVLGRERLLDDLDRQVDGGREDLVDGLEVLEERPGSDADRLGDGGGGQGRRTTLADQAQGGRGDLLTPDAAWFAPSRTGLRRGDHQR